MDTREIILTAAIDVYAQHGFRGATTRRIADAAGVNEVTVFRHFGSKDALLAAAVRHAASQHPAYELPDAPGEPLAELTDWAQAQLDHLRSRGSVIRTCMAEMETRPELTGCAAVGPRAAVAALSRYLLALRAHGFVNRDFDVKAASAMMMGALFADVMSRDMVPELFPAKTRAAHAYASFLLRALGVDQAETGPEPVGAAAPPYLPDATGA